jgi:glycine/D-amino acid oxidase-like deaminating enzyme
MDANVNPYRLVQGYAKGAHEYGSQIMTGTRARGIGISNGRIQNVETNRGTIETPVVVNAAGAYAAEVGRLVGLEIPVVPRRGQIIVTERTDTPKIKSALLSANYFAAKFNPDLAQKNTDFTNIEQMENGTILLGCSLEFAGFDRTTTRETLRGIAERASKIVPGLRNTQIIRSYAGLRPYSPDGLPIMGPVKSMPGFFVATGHSGDGICLSAITGMLLAQQIVHGQSEISLNEFSLDRFQQSKTALG